MGYLIEKDYKAGSVPPECQGISAYNDSGAVLSVGTLVYVSGWTVSADGMQSIRKIAKADADAAAPANVATHVVLEAIGIAGYGRVARAAVLRNVDTSSVGTAGDPVYLHTTAGGWTATAPTATNAVTQRVGYARVKSSTVGELDIDLTSVPETMLASSIRDGTLLGIKASVGTPLAAAGALASANLALPIVLVLDIPDAATGNVDFTSLPYKCRVLMAQYSKQGGAGNAGNNSKVVNQTAGADITDAVNSATDTAVVPAGQLNDAGWTLDAGATIRVSTTKAGGNNAHTWTLLLMRVA